MSKRVGLYDQAVKDFLPITPLHKVEREKDRPWLSDQAIAFLKKKGMAKEENGKVVISVGKGWELAGRVGTRAGHYVTMVPGTEDQKPSV